MSPTAANLPLDAPQYASLRSLLREMVVPDPELTHIEELGIFLREHQEAVGDRTLAEFEAAPDDVKRMMVHYMVLGASEIGRAHV